MSQNICRSPDERWERSRNGVKRIVADTVMSIIKKEPNLNIRIPIILTIDIAVKLEKIFSISITGKMIRLISSCNIDKLVDYILYV